MAAATNRLDPSFAVSALTLLRQNSIVEAAQLCASGVEHYPDYIGGYIVLVSAFESLGQQEDAALIREALRLRFPHLTGFKFYQPGDASDDAHVEHQTISPVVTEEYVLERDQDTETEAEIQLDVALATEEAVYEAETIVEVDVTAEAEAIVEVSAEADTKTEAAPDAEAEMESVHLEIVQEFSETTAFTPEQLVYSAPSHPNVLRLIEMAPVSTDTRIIRSASVRLIPGLEFTSLRFEGTRSRGRREITALLDPPAFRTFHQMRRSMRPADVGEQRKKPVTLEELAARLNDARMPRNANVETDVAREDLSAQQAPIIITETIARIYMQQGSYELAIDAFRALQKQKPEKHGEFEKLIKECERKRS